MADRTVLVVGGGEEAFGEEEGSLDVVRVDFKNRHALLLTHVLIATLLANSG